MYVFLGMTYVDKCLWGVLPMEGKIAPKYKILVSILGRGTEANVTTIFSFEASIGDQNEPGTILFAKCITFTAETELPVAVLTSKCCLMTVGKIQTSKLTQWIPLRELYIMAVQTSYSKY